MCRSVVFWSVLELAVGLVRADLAVALGFLSSSAASRRRLRISTRASSMRLWTTAHQVAPPLLGQRRDVERTTVPSMLG